MTPQHVNKKAGFLFQCAAKTNKVIVSLYCSVLLQGIPQSVVWQANNDFYLALNANLAQVNNS